MSKQIAIFTSLIGFYICLCAVAIAVPPTHTISGFVLTGSGSGVEGVRVAGDNGATSTLTGADGSYSITVSNHWDGTVTVSKTGWLITPPSKTYTNVSADIANENYTAYQPKISGYVTKQDSTPLAGVSVTADNGGGSDTSDATGYYEFFVPYNWTGTTTASLAGYGFTSKPYSSVTTDITNQNFSGFQPTISGSTGQAGAAVSASGVGYVISNPAYSITVPYAWSGTISATLTDYNFPDSPKTYTNVTTDQINQNFAPYQPTISGTTGVAGTAVTISGVGTVVSNPTYSVTVPYEWSGTVSAELAGCYFGDSPKTYTNVITDQTSQNFTPYQPTVSGSTGVAGATVTVSGVGTVISTPEYSVAVPYNWSGTISVELAGYTFPQSPRSYNNIISDQTNQYFIPYKPIISGYVNQQDGAPLKGVKIRTQISPGYYTSAITDPNGYYELLLPNEWSGVTTASVPGWEFTPQSYSYTSLVDNQPNQNFYAVYTGIITVKKDYSGHFNSIQPAINTASGSETVIVYPGIYYEKIKFYGKNIILRSTCPEDLDVVSNTVIDAEISGTVVTFSGTETADCRLEGFRITGGNRTGYVNIAGGIMGDGTNATITNCIITFNSSRDGGGLYHCDGAIRNCIISNNFAENLGGGLKFCDGTIQNCIISNNLAYYKGGGLYDCDGTIENCTISNNSIYYSNDGSGLSFCYGTIQNCIIWGNDSGNVEQIFSCSPPSYSCIPNVVSGGANNIYSDPLFVDGYHLTINSPCISAGNPSIVYDPNEFDIDNDPRVLGRIEMGADEFFASDSAEMFVYQNNFNFTAEGINSTVSTQKLSILNCGALDMNWSVINDCNWLSITPIVGQTSSLQTDEIVVGINNDHIGYGLQSCQFHITDPSAFNSPQTITVALNVLRPELTLSQNSFSFSGGITTLHQPQLMTIQNTGFDTLNWTITESTPCDWLTVTPPAGQTMNQGPTEVTLSVDPTIAGYGLHTCQLTVSDPNANSSPQTVTVTLDVLRPELAISQNSFTFSTGDITTAPQPQSLTIQNTGFDTLNWTITESIPCDWLTVTPQTGQTTNQTPSNAAFSVDPTIAGYGLHTCQLTVSDPDANSSPQTVTVSFNVWQPVIHLSFRDYNWDLVNGVEVVATGFAEPIIVDGTYDMAVPYGWSGTITPLKPDVAFDPTAIVFENVTQQNLYANFTQTFAYSDGDGSESDPFQIADAEDLRNLADDPLNWDKHFIVINDIDMGDPNAANMETIADYYYKTPFSGVFDGQGFSIINLHIAGFINGGLFGIVGTYYYQQEPPPPPLPMIKNLTLIDPTVIQGDTYYAGTLVDIVGSYATVENCTVEGGYILGDGGLVGTNYGTIQNSHVIDTHVENSYSFAGGLVGRNYGIITDCSASGTVIGETDTGGLVGMSYSGETLGGPPPVVGFIQNCSSSCTVESTGIQNSSAGGLVGRNLTNISQCSSTGTVIGFDNVGGLIGANFSDISQCFSTGTVTGISSVGGVIGNTNSGYTISDCYTHSDVTGEDAVGGFLGSSSGGTLFENCYATGSVIGNTYVGAFTGIGYNWLSYQSCFFNVDNDPNLPGIGSRTDPNVIAATTVAMQTKATYTGWDFVGDPNDGTDDTWDICEGTNYPRLVWQIPAGDFLCPEGVSSEDLSFFADNWLSDGPPDLNGDAITDLRDFAIFAANWLLDVK